MLRLLLGADSLPQTKPVEYALHLVSPGGFKIRLFLIKSYNLKGMYFAIYLADMPRMRQPKPGIVLNQEVFLLKQGAVPACFTK